MTVIFGNEVQQKKKEYFETRHAANKVAMELFQKTYFGGHEPTNEQLSALLASNPVVGCMFTVFSFQTRNDSLLDVLFSSVFSLDDELSFQIEKLEAVIRANGDKAEATTKEVDVLKETIAPKIRAMVDLFDNLKKSDERRQKAGEDMIV